MNPKQSLFFSNAGHAFTHLLMLLFPTVVLALEREWSMGYGELLGLMLAGQILVGLGAVPAGWLADRWSSAKMLIIQFLGCGAASIFTGLAQGTLGIVVGLGLLGLFASIYHPVGIPWLIRNAARRGQALGVNGVCGALGIALAPVVAGGLTAMYSWRAAFIIPGAVSIGFGLVMALSLSRGAIADRELDVQPTPEPSRSAMRRAFVLLTFTMGAAGLVGHTLFFMLPKLFAENLGAGAGGGIVAAGVLAGFAYLLGAVSQLIGGKLADRYPPKLVYTLSIGVFGAMLFLCSALSGAPLVAAAFVAGTINSLYAASENLLLARFSPSKWRSTAFGVRSMLTLGSSAGALPLIAYMHGSTGGFSALLLVLGVLALLAVIAAQLLPGEEGRVERRAAIASPS